MHILKATSQGNYTVSNAGAFFLSLRMGEKNKHPTVKNRNLPLDRAAMTDL